MKKSRMLVVICFLGLAAVTLASNKYIQFDGLAKAPADIIPDHVAYRFVFHQIVSLEKQAQEAENQGKDGQSLRTLFQRRAGLNDEQARVLLEIASDCENETRAQDAKAKIIIDAFKAQYPGGEVPKGQTVAPPPAELQTMQAERNAMILRSRERLHVMFGDDAFQKFDEFVRTHAKQNIHPILPSQQ